MPKRTATTELNSDNWKDDLEPEEPGVFKKASKNVIEKRVIRTAVRSKRFANTGVSGTRPSAFSGFSGFGKMKPAASVSSVSDCAKNAFSFLSNIKNESSEQPGSGKKEVIKSKEFKDSDLNKKDFLSKLKGLNEAFLNWIKYHLEKDPSCILTPVLHDYIKFVKEIESETEGKLDSKSDEKKPFSFQPKFPFSPATSTISMSKNSPGTSIFGNVEEKKKTLSSDILNPDTLKSQFTGSDKKPVFSFGTVEPSGFSFSGLNSKILSGPGAPAPIMESADPDEEDEADEKPESLPKNDFTAVKEDDALYTQRVKVFVKKEERFIEKGVGNLFVKQVDGKHQVVIRADTNLGNIIVNILLTQDVPTKRLGKNNVLMVCVPTPDASPPPVPVLLRVKTAQEADLLLQALDKHKD